MVKGMYSNQTIVTDIHFEIAEKLRAALAPAIAELYVNPDDGDADSYVKVLSNRGGAEVE